MADNLVNITSGSSLLAKTDTKSDYSTGTVTFTIILFLLVVITAVMAYNYWVIYRYVPTTVNSETFSPDLTDSDAATPTSSQQGSGLRPIVQATVERAAKYEEGQMSPELKRYYEENKTRNDMVNSQNPVTGSGTGAGLSRETADSMKQNVQIAGGQGHSNQPSSDQNKAPRYVQISGPSMGPLPNLGQNPAQNLGQKQNLMQATGQASTQISGQNPRQGPVQKPGQNQIKNPNPSSEKKQFVKSVDREPGITKLIVFHMRGCGHCMDIMDRKQENNKTKFEQLTDIFATDPSVQVMDFQYGRDKEAEKYNGFPVILMVTEEGEEEYQGPREVVNIAKAVINKKQ